MNTKLSVFAVGISLLSLGVAVFGSSDASTSALSDDSRVSELEAQVASLSRALEEAGALSPRLSAPMLAGRADGHGPGAGTGVGSASPEESDAALLREEDRIKTIVDASVRKKAEEVVRDMRVRPLPSRSLRSL